MSQLRDDERLELLKEVGGAKLYEDKRDESKKTMLTQREHAETINESVRSLERDLITCSGVLWSSSCLKAEC